MVAEVWCATNTLQCRIMGLIICTRSDILIQGRNESCHRYSENSFCLLTEPYDVTKVLNDISATTDLLDKRGEIYASRPRFVVSYVA